METVLKYDEAITALAEEYNVPKEMVQAVLFQEIRFYGVDDPIADILVKLGIRGDSSTGLGQIFASTALDATGEEVTSTSKKSMWNSLQNNEFNINMVALEYYEVFMKYNSLNKCGLE